MRSHRLAASAALIPSLLAGDVCGQILDLGGGPDPGEVTSSAVGLSTFLDQRIAELRREEQTAQVQAKIAVRQLARELLRGAATNESSLAYVTGRTLMNGLDGIDELIDRGNGGDALAWDARLLMVVRLLETETVPYQPPALDRFLRDSLAPLLDEVGDEDDVAWVLAEPRDAPSQAALDAIAETVREPDVLDPSTLAILNGLLNRIGEGLRWESYRGSALALAWQLQDAVSVLDHEVRWLDEQSRARLVQRLGSVVILLDDPSTRDDGVARLLELDAVGSIIEVADGFDPSRESREAQLRLAEWIASDEPLGNSTDVAFLARVMAMLGSRPDASQRESLVRLLRPTWMTLEREAKAAERPIVALLPRIIAGEIGATDPATLAALDAMRRAVDDMNLLAEASDVMLDPASPASRPTPQRDYQPIANVILALGKELDDREERDEAIARIRAICWELTRAMVLPGERELLRAAGNESSPWSRITGGESAGLADRINNARRALLSARARQSDLEEGDLQGVRIASLHRLMDIGQDAAMCIAMTEAKSSFLNDWPGWEVSRMAMAALVVGLEERLADATRLALVGERERLGDVLDDIEDEFASALLVGRLAHDAESRLVVGDAPRGALDQVARGGPAPSQAWMVSHRQDLAQLCHYLEELAIAIRIGEQDRADELRRYVNQIAQDIRARMEPGLR